MWGEGVELDELVSFVVIDLALAQVVEGWDRDRVFKLARARADELGLPLVNYGSKQKEPYTSLSDFNLDIVPRDVPNFMLVEPGGRLPFPDGGAVVFASHVLEHVDDPMAMLEEWGRVGPTYVVLPRWWNLYNWVHRGHRSLFIGDTVIDNPAKWAIPIAAGAALLKFL